MMQCVMLSHLSNSVYLRKMTYMGSNCLYEMRLFMVKSLKGKQLLIKKAMFCRSLKWMSKMQSTFKSFLE